jgi:LCP family protein required for cell wall assembly
MGALTVPTRLSALSLALLIAACAAVPTLTPAPEPTARPTPTLQPSPRPTPTSEPTARPTPTPAPTPTPVPTPQPTPTPTPLDASLLDRRLTVLFIGKDTNTQRRQAGEPVNTDALVVLSVSADYRRVDLVALPRDMVDVPLGDGRIWTGKINSIYRQLGVEALRRAVSATLGVRIDHYVAIDMNDFGRLVNRIGGIAVHVPAPLADSVTGLYLGAGPQRLDGNNALRYARTRKQDGDYARGRRHQQLMLAMADRLRKDAATLDLVGIVGALGSLETDVPLDRVPTMLEILRRTGAADDSIRVLGPPRFALFEGIEAGPRGWVMIPNLREMRAYVASVMGD